MSGNPAGRPRKDEKPVDPRQVLREIADNKRNPAYARTQAAKALAALGDEPPEADPAHWRRSIQVRPDYTPPTWEEVLAVARKAGADV